MFKTYKKLNGFSLILSICSIISVSLMNRIPGIFFVKFVLMNLIIDLLIYILNFPLTLVLSSLDLKKRQPAFQLNYYFSILNLKHSNQNYHY